MILRTNDGERVRGKMTSDSSFSQDGLPVLLINGEVFPPIEADFYLESANEREKELLEEGGYDLQKWEEGDEGNEEFEPDEE